MEKEMMDKIDRIRDDLKEKILLHNERWEEFRKEFFTDDIKKIIEDLTANGVDISVNLDDEYKIDIDSDLFVVMYSKGKTYYLHLDAYCKKSSRDSYNEYLRKLKIKAECLNRSEKMLNVFIDNADSVIKFISDKYVEINNNRADLINEIVDLLDMDEPKEKHVKITVEWS